MRLLGGYELLGRLAAGARTEVYLARRSSLGFDKLVALKIVQPEDLRAEALARGRAARLLGRFDHPHIVPVLDFGRTDDGLYLVFEYVDGETLAALAARLREREQAIPAAAAAYLGAAIARALDYCREQTPHAHSQGSLRWSADAKNVIIGYDGTVKLIGFEAADTPPEPRHDALRVAAVIWELVTGRAIGAGDSELDWSCAERDLIDARERAYHPSALEELCTSCAPREGADPPALVELARRLEALAREPGGDAPVFDENELRALMARAFSAERARREQLIDMALSTRASVGGLVLDRVGPRAGASRHAERPRSLPPETPPLPPKLTLSVIGAIALIALAAPHVAAPREAVTTTQLAPPRRPEAPAPVPPPAPRWHLQIVPFVVVTPPPEPPAEAPRCALRVTAESATLPAATPRTISPPPLPAYTKPRPPSAP